MNEKELLGVLIKNYAINQVEENTGSCFNVDTEGEFKYTGYKVNKKTGFTVASFEKKLAPHRKQVLEVAVKTESLLIDSVEDCFISDNIRKVEHV